MHSLALVLCLALQGSLGKTDAQILAMGRGKWMDYYTERKGSSTLDMCEAERIFGKALTARNDKLIKKADRAFIKQLRPALTMFQSSVYDVGGALSGGGTIWNIYYSGITADVEEVIGTIAGAPGKKAPPHVVSDVTKAIDELAVHVRANRKDLEAYRESGGGIEAATKGLMGARLAFSEITALAAKRPRSQSDAILEFCIAAIRDVREQGP